MQRDRRRTEHQRKEKCRPPEEKKEYIGKPGAKGTDAVLHGTGTREGKAGITRAVGRERREQHQCDGRNRDHRALTQTTGDGGREAGRLAGRTSVGQIKNPDEYPITID